MVRIPVAGQESGRLAGTEAVTMETTVGVIARNVDDVGVVLGAIEEVEAWRIDSRVVPGRWFTDAAGQRSDSQEKMRVGFLWSDGHATPLPPVRRCMENCRSVMIKHGIQVSDVDTSAFSDVLRAANKMLAAPGNEHNYTLLDQTEEPLIPWLEKSGYGRRKPFSLPAFRDAAARRRELQDQMLHVWKTEGGDNIDVIVLPVAPHPVPPIDGWGGVGYTSSFVFLDWPAASLPVRECVQADLEEDLEGESLGRWDDMTRTLWPESKEARGKYLGSPLSVQVVAPRLQERKLWGCLKTIENLIQMEASPKAKL